jgi:glycogen debranching enzyme
MDTPGSNREERFEVPPEIWARIESLVRAHGERLPGDLSRAATAQLHHGEDRFYIVLPPGLLEDRWYTLKQGDMFVVLDRFGDIPPQSTGGLFFRDTRHLSELSFRIGTYRPVLLKSAVTDDNLIHSVDLTNPDFYREGKAVFRRNSIYISRCTLLEGGKCFQKFVIRNYAVVPVELSWLIEFACDFADSFEARGVPRERRGQLGPVQQDGSSVLFQYRGLDGLRRFTRIQCFPTPSEAAAGFFHFRCGLAPHEELQFVVRVDCWTEAETLPPQPVSWSAALAGAARRLRESKERSAHVYTSNELFNDWVNRSWADLQLLLTDTPSGLYPYAGIPWFSAVFGRDGAISAYQALWVDPDIAAGVLRHLAQSQATELDPVADAEPGKILHEVRQGEMARTGEVPFRRYYGSIDATPLFLWLAYEYTLATGDLGLTDQIWPHIEAAVRWMEQYGDRDGDGFLEYQRQSPQGLRNQGWKDSEDSVFHNDGRLAEGPIAVCEVQAYAYGAWRGVAELARLHGRADQAAAWHQQAETLRHRFEETFWDPALGTYVLALDGRKRPCRVRASNAGQCLVTGIVATERAQTLVGELFSPRFFSGWGIRTLAEGEPRYNPMSYHNGSVWPHDNSLIAAGLARYGWRTAAARLLQSFFEASLYFDLRRMPELFCGFAKRPGEGPTLYPGACAPQAWAAGSVFLLLGATLGLQPLGLHRRLCICRPYLPEFLPEVQLTNLRVGPARLDLVFRRYGDDVTVHVIRREGPVEVVTVH